MPSMVQKRFSSRPQANIASLRSLREIKTPNKEICKLNSDTSIMLNSVLNVQVSDTTGVNSSNADGYTKISLMIPNSLPVL